MIAQQTIASRTGSHPRVAFFCETFNEINGVALTARQFADFAARHERPFLSVHSGPELAHRAEGSVRHLELPRSRASFGIERDLSYDLFLWRHTKYVRKVLEEFRPDVIHVTSPGEFGQLGALLSHTMRIPLVASWHTNLHQFAARRLSKLLAFLPEDWTERASAWAEDAALVPILRFYRIARATLAPTQEQVRWLENATRRASFLMPRGVDCSLFNPLHRTVCDKFLRIGYVGRVTPEKRVRFLADIEKALLTAGVGRFEISVVGDGSERTWLQQNLRHGVLAGILRGHFLAEAYANMDLFVFPSRTDTFGNVIQEAAASGVPAIVTSEGGPKDLVTHGVTGFVAGNDAEFLHRVVELARAPERLCRMGEAARERVLSASWDAAFEMTYTAYRYCLRKQEAIGPAGGSGILAHTEVPAA
ncbi:MAG: glycosyltransferase [Acidobacteria bacterium]|nr:glycosyltransferase [Acidobacteriota bacterium]